MTFTDEESIIADILDGIDTVPEMLDKHVPPETGYKYFRERYGAILRNRIRKSEVIIEIGMKKYPYTRRMVKRYGLITQADCSRCRHGGRA
ncbi:MAG: hypothetical protein IJG07_13605 [Prevotella sp.]|nr:hypothetical protein [Prevotella sp.]